MMSHFEKSVVRVSGNERVNLIAGWHGATKPNARASPEQLFEPEQLKT